MKIDLSTKTKCKIFHEINYEYLEENINSFIENCSNLIIVDIKFWYDDYNQENACNILYQYKK